MAKTFKGRVKFVHDKGYGFVAPMQPSAELSAALKKANTTDLFLPPTREFRPFLTVGAVFEGTWIENYKGIQVERITSAPPSAQASLPIDSNPYNFAEWEGDKPWPQMTPQNAGASHEMWDPDRLSGSIELVIKAESPVFVPGTGTAAGSNAPLDFWSALDPDGKKRFAIPGSSVKGVVRTLVETWTNGHLGVVSSSLYRDPIPYRRRMASLWVVTAIDQDTGERRMRSCEVCFAKKEESGWSVRSGNDGNGLVPWDQGNPEPQEKVIIGERGWQAIPYRANLFWVPWGRHHHRYTHLLVRVEVESEEAVLTRETFEWYTRMLKHEAFRKHPDRVAVLPDFDPKLRCPKKLYTGFSHESIQRAMDEGLGKLGVGDVVFAGVEKRDVVFAGVEKWEVVSFGKNVHFLWPSKNSPEQLLQHFFRRENKGGLRLHLRDADSAEAMFGFAATHESAEGQIKSHPFKGRVRFGTFWAQGQVTSMNDVRLNPLTSPSGVKLKARPTYLPGDKDGWSSTYDDAQRLRGRKFYWHQRPMPNQRPIARTHLRPTGVEGPQYPPPIRPLSRGTTFAGVVHFDNLCPEELGALLVSLCPDLFFKVHGKSTRNYGWKIGKGKPRGLGSVTVPVDSIRLTLRNHDSYQALSGPAGIDATSRVAGFVSNFVKWLDDRGKGCKPAVAAQQIGFVRDLERLLRLPSQSFVCDYLKPGEYGWMPSFDDPHGGPSHKDRKKSMNKARDIEVP